MTSQFRTKFCEKQLVLVATQKVTFLGDFLNFNKNFKPKFLNLFNFQEKISSLKDKICHFLWSERI